jgi:glycosyltransferase involved in cell wall biosynthesis
LILEDALRNLDTYAYLARRKRRHLPTAFWGPGQTLDRETGHLEAACKRTLLKRGDWWFAYTQGCADHLASTGIPRESITIVGNTFDTESLAAAASGITGLEVATKRAELGLTEGHSALFIGGLAAVKNLDLLIESGRLVSAGDPAFRVVVVGDGPMRAVVEQASRDLGFVVTCGPLFDPREKALVAAACDLIAAPGLVGLVAVDSLVLGRPIVTVKPWHHSPEIEYLTDGETAIFAKPLPSDYARALSEMLGESDLRKRLQAQCIAEGLKYSLGQMVERFQTGVHAALAAR